MTNASETTGAAQLAKRPGLVVATLGLLLGLQPVSTDLYLPALPAMAGELGSPMGPTQLTLSALILAFGSSQLLVGPLADRHGRRPVLVAGLLLYALAAAAAAAAQDIVALVGWRAAQGVGLACAVVCARAMLRDLYEPGEGARVMARSLSVLGLLALSSPVLGSVLASHWGWRAALAANGVFAALTLALLLARVPETLRQPNLQALQLGPMFATWRRMTRHPAFVAWTLLVTCTYGGLYTFLASSSFVFIEVLGTSRLGYGLVLAGASTSYIAGTLWCRRLLPSHGLAGAVRRATGFTVAGGVGMLGAWALAGTQPAAAALVIALAQCLYLFGHGVHQPCAQAAVPGPFPAQAGAASALSGFVMSCAAFGIGGWLGWTLDGTVRTLVGTVAVLAAATATVALTLVQRHGEPVREAAQAAAPTTPVAP